MPEHAAEPVLSGLRLNLRIVSVVIFNFASYLTIGLPLAVLPGYVHDVMGFSAFWAGLVISLQYFATLLSRPHAGRYADLFGPKRIVIVGLCGCFLSGLGYLLAATTSHWPLVSLALLCLGRVILGIGQSLAGTGSTLWGVGVVGASHIGRVISWNGIVTYGAMALGAPLGVICYAYGGLSGLAITIMVVALLAILFALPRPKVKASKGKPLPFRAVLGRVWPYGMALALATTGFGVIATFITLFYDAKGWDGAAFALTLFSCAFVGARLLFPNGINRLGGTECGVDLLCGRDCRAGVDRDCHRTVDGENGRFPRRRWLFAGLPGTRRGRGKSRAAAEPGVGAGDLHGVYGHVAGHYRAAGGAGDGVGRGTGNLSCRGGSGGYRIDADMAAKKWPRCRHRGHVIIVKNYWITMVLMMFSAAVCAFC